MKAASCAIGLLCGVLSCTPVFGKDVLLYKVSKGFHYQQAATAPPTLLIENGYVFEAAVNLPLPGSVTSAIVESTEGTDRTLAPDGNDQLEFRNRVNTRNTLDTRYPDGPFRFTINAVQDGQKVIGIPLTDNAYPPAPRIANLSQLQLVNAKGYTVVHWDAFAGGNAADFIQLRIEETDGDLVFETRDFNEAGALDGTATHAILEPDTLKPGTTYEATLRFDKTSAYGISTYVGVPGWSTHHALTRFAIVTSSAGEPAIESYTLTKGRRFEQQSGGPPIPDLNDEHVFSADVKFASDTAEIGVMLSTPIGEEPIALGIFPGESTYTAKTKTQEELDVLYPSGNYIFSFDLPEGTRTLAIGLDGNAYLPVPRLTNFDPSQEVRADRSLVFEWESWSGGDANDFIQFRIEDSNGNKVFETKDFGEKGALTGRGTWAMVPGNTLKAGAVYKGTLQFTRVIALDDTSNPGSLGRSQYYSRTKFTIIAGPPDLIGFRIVKGREYRQTAAESVVPDGYVFSAVASAASTSSLQSVSLEVPGRGAVPVPVQSDGRTFSLAQTYATQDALDAAYPNGTYRLSVRGANDGLRTLSMDIVGDAYPNGPVITEYDSTGQIFPWFDFPVYWLPFEGARSRDFIFLDIFDQTNGFAYATGDYRRLGALAGLNTVVLIPAEVLLFNAAYTARVMFERVTTVEDPNYPSVEGRTGYYSRTRWTMLTLGDGNPTSFLSWSRAADGTVEFGFPSVSGGTYVIEGSTDLVNWAPVTAITASQEQSIFRVPPGASHFFYRAALTR